MHGFLLDIDDTLYDYGATHKKALEHVVAYCQDNFELDRCDILNAYQLSRKQTHLCLHGQAASHNRLLYFQGMLKQLALNPLQYGLTLYNLYWDKFLMEMTLFPGVATFFDKYGDRTCLLTDLTSHIQFRKVQQLGLHEKCRHIVTSEEAGHEKPHPLMFLKGMSQLQLPAEELCMIGDNYEKDILGALNMGMSAIWLNTKGERRDYSSTTVTEVNSFEDVVTELCKH